MDKILKNIKENGISNLEVFEENNGALTLAVWCDDEFFCSSGFEYSKGSLVEILKDLQNEKPNNWNDMKEMTEDEYYSMSFSTVAGRIILDLDGGFVDVDRMGVAARKEFSDYLNSKGN